MLGRCACSIPEQEDAPDSVEGELATVCWHLNRKYSGLDLDADIASDPSNACSNSELARIGAALLTGCISCKNRREYVDKVCSLDDDHVEVLMTLTREIDPSLHSNEEGDGADGSEEDDDCDAGAAPGAGDGDEAVAISAQDSQSESDSDDGIAMKPSARRSSRLATQPTSLTRGGPRATATRRRRTRDSPDSDSDSDSEVGMGVSRTALEAEVAQLRERAQQASARAADAEAELEAARSQLEAARKSSARDDAEAAAHMEAAGVASAKLVAAQDELRTTRAELKSALADVAA